MAVLRIPDEERSLREQNEVRDYLARIGIEYERWETPANLPENALVADPMFHETDEPFMVDRPEEVSDVEI